MPTRRIVLLATVLSGVPALRAQTRTEPWPEVRQAFHFNPARQMGQGSPHEYAGGRSFH